MDTVDMARNACSTVYSLPGAPDLTEKEKLECYISVLESLILAKRIYDVFAYSFSVARNYIGLESKKENEPVSFSFTEKQVNQGVF